MDAAQPSTRRIAGAFIVDALLVLLFAVIGRASHAEHLTFAGVAETAWPFLAALVVGWLIALAWRAPLAPVRTGLAVWAVTLVGGMLLRAATGQGTALAFIVVASLVLLLFLVGWRVLMVLLRRGRRSPEG